MDKKITILIADDHPIFRQGLRHIIEREADLEIVSEAGDGEAALSEIAAVLPQVVILDVDMPKINGFTVLNNLQEKQSTARVILLTVHDEEEFFSEALAARRAGLCAERQRGRRHRESRPRRRRRRKFRQSGAEFASSSSAQSKFPLRFKRIDRRRTRNSQIDRRI